MVCSYLFSKILKTGLHLRGPIIFLLWNYLCYFYVTAMIMIHFIHIRLYFHEFEVLELKKYYHQRNVSNFEHFLISTDSKHTLSLFHEFFAASYSTYYVVWCCKVLLNSARKETPTTPFCCLMCPVPWFCTLECLLNLLQCF